MVPFEDSRNMTISNGLVPDPRLAETHTSFK